MILGYTPDQHLQLGSNHQGVPNGARIAGCGEILLVAQPREERASEFIVAGLARSPIKLQSLRFNALRHYALHFSFSLLFLAFISTDDLVIPLGTPSEINR